MIPFAVCLYRQALDNHLEGIALFGLLALSVQNVMLFWFHSERVPTLQLLTVVLTTLHMLLYTALQHARRRHQEHRTESGRCARLIMSAFQAAQGLLTALVTDPRGPKSSLHRL